MALPNAPMPLINQVGTGVTITLTIPLKGIGAAPGFGEGGSAYNSGSPTFTLTATTRSSPVTGSGNRLDQLIDLAEQMWREGTLTGS